MIPQQCADEAPCLTALLRAVGIPAHDVSADAAALETGAASWTFDTWVEFLASHAGSTDWRILHSHEYPNMQPESRATFGSIRGVATKSFNDVIIMANENWVFAQLDDGTPDVSYGRNSCQEPNQSLNKASWIGELCEQGYWASPHWDCSGVRPRSFRPGNGFRIHSTDTMFGGRVAGTLHAINAFDDRSFGSLTVDVVSALPESKQFPKTVFTGVKSKIVMDKGEAVTLPFDLRLPDTLPRSEELYLWAHLDGHTVALHKLQLRPPVFCECEVPRNYRLGESTRIRARISVLNDKPLRDVIVTVDATFALDVERVREGWSAMQPREVREASWSVRALAPLRSGSLRISIATANAGSLVLRYPFQVAGPTEMIKALSAFLPKRR